MVVLFSGYKLQGLYDSINWTDFHSLLLKMDQFVLLQLSKNKLTETMLIMDDDKGYTVER